MTGQQKLTYTQVKDRYETLRREARDAAHKNLSPVLINKKRWLS